MSGKKQHYIPQSFQRPFQIDENAKSERVWCYRKLQQGAFLGRIADIAAERHFYSNQSIDETETLDDAITKYENRLAYLLRNIRELSNDDAVASDIAAEIIAHLTFRAKSIRHFMQDGAAGIVEKLSILLKRGFMVSDFPAAPISLGIETKLIETLKEQPDVQGLEISDKTLSRIAYAYLRENAESFVANARSTIRNFKDT